MGNRLINSNDNNILNPKHTDFLNKTFNTMKFTPLLLAGYLLASSNAQSLRRAKEEEPQEKILAKLDLPDESSVTFKEIAGNVIALGEFSNEEKALEAGLDDIEKPFPVDVWKALTDEKVPKELQDADDRARMVDSPLIPDDEEEFEDDADPEFNAAMQKSYSCNYWENYKCWHSNKSVCFSCVTGRGMRTKRTKFVHSRASCYRGRVNHYLKTKNCSSCSWRYIVNKSISHGSANRYHWLQGWSTTSSKAYFQFGVTNASGDRYHWTARWR